MAAGSGRFPRVAVLKGGMSAEREVSLSTGHECAKALREAGYTEVIEVDCGPDLVGQLQAIKPDVVFNALHGRWGEDGCVQGILEWLRLPYTHSGVLASSLAMDKQRAKEAYRAAGLPVVDSVLAAREAVEQGHILPPPYVVKPNNEGSSVGVYIVYPGSNAPRLAATMPAQVMVETYAPGRELSISVMGDRALGVTDILTDGWYDYDAKYKPGGSRHQLPANMPDDVTAACLDYALRAHRALGCRGLSRTDIRWDDTRGVAGLVLLETNTQPGMTPTSLAPEQAAYCGHSFADLCDWLVKDASCDR
jgi:D-alanine-D-alanine ligase